MIWIDLDNRLPTDTDLPGWKAWTAAEWQAWLAKSQELVKELARLEATGQREARNELIDRNKPHWDELKPWLWALSGGKCWFSEVKELFSHYDVEHFRPKKEAKELNGKQRDGYWWLAFDHMNLRLCGNVGNRKKGGWFPLRNDSLCSTYQKRCERAETSYLIDPIDAGDVALVAFDEEGKAVAAPGISQWEQQRVEQTVKRLKLNEHVVLTEARLKLWQKVSRLIEKYRAAKVRCATGDDPSARAELVEICRQLRELSKPDSELSSVVKWCVLLRNDPSLSRLLS